MSATLVSVRGLVANRDLMLSNHASLRLLSSGILLAEVTAGVAAAIVVEDCPSAHKGPSVLVLQDDGLGQPIHVLRGIRAGTSRPAVLITVYRPDPNLWSADFRSRL